MNKIKELAKTFLEKGNADAVAVAIIDFRSMSFESFEISDVNKQNIYFDLASLTKPLTNSFYTIANDVTDKELLSTLNHRAGLISWGILGKNWKKQILDYSIIESKTQYSDFSALRFMLEIERNYGISYKEEVLKNLDSEIYFWKDLPKNLETVQNGFKNGKENFRFVHDPNAFHINEFTSHAGLFGTISGVCRTLIDFEKKHEFIKKVSKEMLKSNDRFIYGFDTARDLEKTLAGKGCSDSTFGHLGFTGTSFWIDAKQMKGHVILSNSTKYYWFDKVQINALRRAVGELTWENSI